MKYILAVIATVIATQSPAQSRQCAEHGAVVESLASRYGESRVSIALGSDNSVVETFVNSESGSWTITVTRPGGPTCLVAAGQNFELTNEPLPAPGIDG